MVDSQGHRGPTGAPRGAVEQARHSATVTPSTEGEATRPSTPFTPPTIALPKGGGAIRGIGEKFAANPLAGTGSFSLPVPASPGRSGFQPELALSYDSGAGNGTFGLGWTIGLPTITRKSDKGLPRYDDASESDVFILSGAEDLVPAFRLTETGDVEVDGQNRPIPDEGDHGGYHIVRYRPRTEGLFARIERWTNDDDKTDVFWRTITRDNVTSFYGRDRNSRIFDPETESHVYGWLVCESYDDKGNGIQYAYKEEDAKGVDLALPHEQHRGAGCTAQRYIKSIRYGNRVSRLHPQPPAGWREDWLFEVVFDYGEGHYADLPLDQATPADEQHRFSQASLVSTGDWPVRPDPFSTYRAGFEVRTYRRCHRVLMFHRIPELGGEPYLVRALELGYADIDPADAAVGKELQHDGSTRFASFLVSATQHGYEQIGPQVTAGPHEERYLRYLRQSMPPVTFRYSRPLIDPEIRTLDVASAANLPVGLGGECQWVDLDAEGISGVLTEQGGAWWYKRNKGGGKLAGVELVAQRPAAGLGAGRQLLDLAGDGALDLVELSGGAPGFYERTEDGDFTPHRSFRSLPNLRWDDPNLRFIDLNGDGHADVLITQQDAFTWHPSLAEEGFGSARRTVQPFDEAYGPRLVFADGTYSVYLADMSGDGLADLVRITNGAVSYWPNLGYGRFGSQVVMDNPPVFDHDEQFGQQRVRLADIDGSGVTDIIYLGRDGARVYFNQSGNRWTDALPLTHFPLTDNTSSVSTVDLLGNGTSCLVWSSPLPGDARSPLRYIDLMAGGKPHLLVEVHNNLGAETLIQYAPSTRFYLADKAKGEPWITRLPFPVHVVERVETIDRVSRNRFASRYEYHHGYFDGIEREFRGFGRVDQYDTEAYELLDRPAGESDAPNLEASAYVPPVLTRTWFHTGVHLGRRRISQLYAAEYYREPALTDDQAAEQLLDDTRLPPHLTLDEERQACRALRGSMLRQEMYALDGSAEEGYPFGHPYVATEQSYSVRLVQPHETHRHAVFLTHPAETIRYHYERNPADPRVAHSLTIDVNSFGQVTRSASIGYGRRTADGDLAPELQAEQQKLLANCTDTTYTNALVVPARTPDDHRTPAPFESRTYHLTGLDLPQNQVRLTLRQVEEAVANAGELAYDGQATTGQLERRLIEQERTRYRKDDLSGPCDWGEIEPRALPFETYRLAFTPGLLGRTYTRRAAGAVQDLLPDPAAILPVDASAAGNAATDRGGYVDLNGDGNWWIPSGRLFYSPEETPVDPARELDTALQRFFLPHRYRNPFHTSETPTETTVAYDAHYLQTVTTTDALRNQVTAELDYRVLAPKLLTDANGNQSAVAFDALGMVIATATMGKTAPHPWEGDELSGLTANLTVADVRMAFADPLADPHALLGQATTRLVYDLFAYQRTKGDAQPAPAAVYALARETHVSDLSPDAETRVQHAFSYSDGFGREIQKKVQAEPGLGPVRDGTGRIVVVNGRPQMSNGNIPQRWVGSGWTEFNNKGKPVRQYEPFFSDTHLCDFEARIGVTKTLFYDPVERVVAVLHPNHTYEKVVFDPWRQRSYDVNDTIAPHDQQTGDPRTDPDIAGFVMRYFDRQDPDWQTWLAQRQGADVSPDEGDAATKATVHADTPTTAYLDTLGRTFLTRAHNGFTAGGDPVRFDTRVVLDIEGNQRAVVDAEGRTVMTYDYDMLGNRTRQSSLEAGERWTLSDVAGKSIRAWDSRGHDFRTEYDPLRRPERQFVSGTGPASDPDTHGGPLLYQRVEYGEGQPTAAADNLRGRVFRQFDGAGVVTHRYDFKGNVTSQVREVAVGVKAAIDWTAPQPPGERFVTTTRYDALNRPIQILAPHLDDPAARRHVVQPAYNEANLLGRLHVWTGRPADPDGLLDPAAEPPSDVGVDDIDHDAKGQRTCIAYRNGVTTTYEYDPNTFRLIHLYTRRGTAFTDDCGGDPPPPRTAAPDRPPVGKPCGLQNLHYTYDPAGNITRIRDDAQQTVFFRNTIVDPSNDYTYDAVYRLVQALGREHVGQAGGPGIPHSYNDVRRTGLPHPNDGGAIGRYCETYLYDRVGNILAMKHHQACPGVVDWSRTYAYDEPTQLDDRDAGGAMRRSNRLSASTVAGDTETYSTNGDGYDPHGNMLRMPQLQELAWDFHDQLRMTQRQAINAADDEGTQRHGERTYYVYDADGQRVRKVTETAAGALIEERLYLGGFEVYRKHSGQHAGLVRETLHVMGDKQRIALVETRNHVDDGTPVEVIRYQLGNHLGSASLEVDEQQQIISYEEYTPYGSTSYQAVRKQVQVASKRYRYTGKERDEESGLYYHGARYYAPWLACWISCDPVHPVDGNKYKYVTNNPVRLVDPSGADEDTAALLKRSMERAPRYQKMREELSNQNAAWRRGDAAAAKKHGDVWRGELTTSIREGQKFSTKALAGVSALFAAPFVITQGAPLAMSVVLNPAKSYVALSVVTGLVDPNPAGSIDVPGPVDDITRVGKRAAVSAVDELTDSTRAVLQSGTRRSSVHVTVDAAEQKALSDEFARLGGDPSVLRFNQGSRTGVVDATSTSAAHVNIRGDVFKSVDPNQVTAGSQMSSTAVLAHELEHLRSPLRPDAVLNTSSRAAEMGLQQPGTQLRTLGSWNDEFRASYMASKNPALNAIERGQLVLDALDRAKACMVQVRCNSYMEQILEQYSRAR